jgi:hypothetical protein
MKLIRCFVLSLVLCITSLSATSIAMCSSSSPAVRIDDFCLGVRSLVLSVLFNKPIHSRIAFLICYTFAEWQRNPTGIS